MDSASQFQNTLTYITSFDPDISSGWPPGWALASLFLNEGSKAQRS